MTLIPQLKIFEESVGNVLKDVKSEKEIVNLIKPHLKELLKTDGLIPEQYSHPKEKKYSQYLLYQPLDQSFSVVAFIWGPGHTAPIHDHLTWGLVGIYQGAIEETRYVKVDNNKGKDGLTLNISERIIANKHDISTVYPPNSDIHSVRNPYSETAISIHVYGADIGKQQRHLYQGETFTVNPIITAHDNDLPIYR